MTFLIPDAIETFLYLLKSGTRLPACIGQQWYCYSA